MVNHLFALNNGDNDDDDDDDDPRERKKPWDLIVDEYKPGSVSSCPCSSQTQSQKKNFDLFLIKNGLAKTRPQSPPPTRLRIG